jgi:hypothetical protein
LLEPQKTETAALPTATEKKGPEEEKPLSLLQRLRQQERD